MTTSEDNTISAELTEKFRTSWGDSHSGGDRVSSLLLGALDKAVGAQTGTISKYVDSVTSRKSTYDQQQAEVDSHFIKLVTGTGAAAGGAAAIPGVGFVTGAAAVAAESVVFLESAAWYILASAKLRGIDISNKDLRRALVMLILSGSKGTAIVDTFFSEDEQAHAAADRAKHPGTLGKLAALSRFSAPTLEGINGRLAKSFSKHITKRFKWAWASKLMPLGIGAVLGGVANRKLAKLVIANAHEQLDRL